MCLYDVEGGGGGRNGGKDMREDGGGAWMRSFFWAWMNQLFVH